MCGFHVFRSGFFLPCTVFRKALVLKVFNKFFSKIKKESVYSFVPFIMYKFQELFRCLNRYRLGKHVIVDSNKILW